jgi:hypothetical protein
VDGPMGRWAAGLELTRGRQMFDSCCGDTLIRSPSAAGLELTRGRRGGEAKRRRMLLTRGRRAVGEADEAHVASAAS